MAGAGSFPLPFRSLRAIQGEGSWPFVVGAMFTAEYADKAARLAASCEKFSLPYVLHEVPAVHASISLRGGSDISYTKANFISHLLKTFRKPVLYLDADCEFIAKPDLIADLVRSGCDFAIYNWLADVHNDIFKPVELPGYSAAKGRFFRYAGGVNWYSTRQLICSGLAQFYGNSRTARALLASWQKTIESFPGSADDQCLDFTFNNLKRSSWLYWFLKVRWLPKAYARIAFWICTEPVINHPDFPSMESVNFVPIRDPSGRQRRYRSLMEKKRTASLFPRDCLIDTEQQTICRLVDGQLIPVERTEQKFWL